MKAQETASQDATIQISTEFAFDEASDGRSLLAGTGEERLELLPNDFVEQRLLRLVAFVLCHADPVGTG